MKKLMAPILLFSLICFSCATQGGSGGEFSSQADNAAEVRFGDFDEIHHDTFYVNNCIWGKGYISNYEHFIYQADIESALPTGWKWRWPQINTNQVKAYPSIAYGQNPWRNVSTIPQLPRMIQDLEEVSVSYRAESLLTGKYNLAFDLWFTETAGRTDPPEANILREVMIWQDYKGPDCLPENWFVRIVTIDGEDYRLYMQMDLKTEDYVRDYFAFLKVEPEYAGDTDILAFIRYLEAEGYLEPADYLRNVDLGNEIWYGSGETVFYDFKLTIR